MVNSPEKFDRQRLRSPEAAEAHQEARPEQLDPVETVESLDRKIADIDSRIGGYAESVEETNARLTQARAELGMPPMTTEAPSIAQSREAAARLEEQKRKLVAQKEHLDGGAEATEKEDEFKEVIPRGWTTLKHGTNLMNWGDSNPYTSDRITLEKPLSVISQEDFERNSKDGTRYDTTESYSSISRPEGMSQEEFEAKNKPFEIKVVFLKNHAQDHSDPEYRDNLDKPTLDRIAKYYFANIQRGRHPLVPKGETLVRLGQTQENGRDVFYFVPESIAEAYAKEAGIILPAKAESHSSEQPTGRNEILEKSKRLEDDPRYKSLFDDANEHYRMIGAQRLKIDGAALDGYIRASAAESFKQFYPEDAKAYQETSQAEVEARKAVEAEKAQATREAERVKKEAEARVQKEAKDAAAATETERRENVELGSFDGSIDDFIGGGIIPNELGTQLKARRRSGTPNERHAFDEAVGQASYDFRIKGGGPDALVRALTDLSEGRVNIVQVNETSSEQSTTATRAFEAVTSGTENAPTDRASAADQQNVRRGLENLWANSGLSDNRLVQLREKIAMGSAEEVRALNADVMKATRTFARTRDADALAQTLMRLASQGSESGAKVGGAQDEVKRTYADLGVDTPDVALNPEQTTRETESSGTKNILADEKLKREKTGSAIMQFSQSPELFVDQIEDSDADYSPKKGIKVMVDAFKALYPNPGERAARLQSIYAAYRTTREAYKNQHPEKGADFEANYASKQTAVGLPERESRELQNYISRKLDITHPGGSKTRFTTELVMTDFLRFLDNLNA
jgi:hypothetical protein